MKNRARILTVATQVKPRPEALSRLLLVYFLLSIAVLGGILGYGLAVPFWTIGYFWKPAHELAGDILASSVFLLLKVQPWLDAEVVLDLPDRRLQNFITISNHRSHLDMFILLAHIPNIRVVTKASLFRIPFLGFMMRIMRMIPVKRNDMTSYWQAMNIAIEGALKGDAVHIFPEMSRGEPATVGTGEFHLAPFRVALQARIPVVPIVFHGTDRVWPKGSAALSFREPIRVECLSKIDSQEFSSAENLRAEVQRRINECLINR